MYIFLRRIRKLRRWRKSPESRKRLNIFVDIKRKLKEEKKKKKEELMKNKIGLV